MKQRLTNHAGFLAALTVVLVGSTALARHGAMGRDAVQTRRNRLQVIKARHASRMLGKAAVGPKKALVGKAFGQVMLRRRSLGLALKEEALFGAMGPGETRYRADGAPADVAASMAYRDAHSFKYRFTGGRVTTLWARAPSKGIRGAVVFDVRDTRGQKVSTEVVKVKPLTANRHPRLLQAIYRQFKALDAKSR